MKKDYKEEAQYLAHAARIGAETLRNYGLTLFPEEENNRMIKFYFECEYNALNREPQFANLKSLKYLEQDIFTFFQEYSAPVVNSFWEKIKEANLPFKRVNHLEKILKRKKINNRQEYDYIIDAIAPFQQDGILSEGDMINLNNYIDAFEEKNKGK